MKKRTSLPTTLPSYSRPETVPVAATYPPAVTTHPFRFGIQLHDAPDRKAWLDTVKQVEDLGYSTVFLPDHFGEQLAPVPALMAAADATTTLRIGALVFDNDYKHPVVLAKEAATMDVLSEGRLELGIGAGWMISDYEQSGIPYDPAGVRVSRMEEGVQVLKGLLRADAPFSFSGEHYTITDLHGFPKPVQQPHPPVLIGGGGEQLTLRVVARLADRSNFGGKPHEFAHKCEVLKEHCKAVGRDYDEIEKTISQELFVRSSEAEIEAKGRSTFGEPLESWRQGNLVGTPEQVAEKVQQYVELGATGFFPWCADYPDTTSMRLFAEEVMPQLR
jgi:probable F420-dependent oxidoreductase